MEIESYGLIPEMHVRAYQLLDSSNDNTVITIVDGMAPLVTPSGKLPKTSYRIGGSLHITRLQSLELGLGYDYGMSKKFRSHSGYISARASF